VNSATSAAPNYFRAALANQYNVILFAGSVSFAAALASWAPLVSGLVGEALWLVTGPRLGVFKRRADAIRERMDSERAMSALGPEYGPGFAMVRSAITQIEHACAARSDLFPQQREEVSRRLRPMFQGYLDVCSTHQRLRRVAAQAPLAELQAELSSLHQSLATETDLGMRASLRRAQTVAERRIRQLEGNEAACRSLEMALQTLQKSLAYLEEFTAGMGGAIELCAEIDAAVAQLGRAALLEAERENDLTQGRVSVLPPALN
jgi:hypothetical protein